MPTEDRQDCEHVNEDRNHRIDILFRNEMFRKRVERDATLRIWGERNSYELLIRIEAHLSQVLPRLVNRHPPVDAQMFKREQHAPRALSFERFSADLACGDADFLWDRRVQRHADL